ncbi:hypothetical protein DDV21_004490 [Streptococcus chenjunshii]|uniref:TipC family immunity protein n=3 Tax=Streptococcus chenjunshii TaxID=2173853 RepID=A0A346NBJ3_9STRE|nr:TipC family immunity protein [Streptococcus chenjunshii]AXQ78388.1 hypothetical protein DDV21_004490 [Streptococcus chenjunshii]RFU49937.1 hypothetical protein DDV22_11310 [Streptococcus chenjunshii]
MKKAILMTVLVLMILSAGLYYHYARQPQNIFDEMYQETKKTYRSHNILGNIEGFDIRGSWPIDDPNIAQAPFGTYSEETTFNGYSDIAISFNFQSDTKLISLTFERDINSKIRVRIWGLYTYKDRTLKKSVKIALKQGDSNKYIDKASQVRKYLADYGITAADLDRYYDEIINQKVLTDWCAIYDSKYSPADYGHVKVVTEWEKW